MKFIDLIKEKQADNMNKQAPTVAFMGDSVTQGCFEIYQKADKSIGTAFDKSCAYHNYFAKAMSVLYPSVPINIVNAGINGDFAPHGLERLDRDVLSKNPDLVIICFGLNDVNFGRDRINEYTAALDKIFKRLNKEGIETIFMTPNMMNTEVSCHIESRFFRDIAEMVANNQTDGTMDLYMNEARRVCRENGITICDCYEKWQTMRNCGVDTTELLSNKINHPTREMNWLFAVSLIETIMKG